MRLIVFLKVLLFYLCIGTAFFLFTGFSYLDPGTGSLAIQIIIASVIAVAATLKRFWKNITGYLKRKKKEH